MTRTRDLPYPHNSTLFYCTIRMLSPFLWRPLYIFLYRTDPKNVIVNRKKNSQVLHANLVLSLQLNHQLCKDMNTHCFPGSIIHLKQRGPANTHAAPILIRRSADFPTCPVTVRGRRRPLTKRAHLAGGGYKPGGDTNAGP